LEISAEAVAPAATIDTTVEGFSGRLRDEIDLDTLSVELLAVVEQTMQPTAVSLWLRPSALTPSRAEG
jgi:hypothetical protein